MALHFDTGVPRVDVEDDFLRARRQHMLDRLVSWLRREPDDTSLLQFDEVVGRLGFRGEYHLGVRTIRLDTVVGTVEKARDFDRRFRPTSDRDRQRWEQLDLAERGGAVIPPIEVYRIGGLHFVKDGHHRVSVAMAAGQVMIDADVTEVLTHLPATGISRRSDLMQQAGINRPDVSHSEEDAADGRAHGAREILVDRAERDRLRPFGRADQLGLQGLPRRRGQRPPGPDREDQRDRAHHGGRHRGAGDPRAATARPASHPASKGNST